MGIEGLKMSARPPMTGEGGPGSANRRVGDTRDYSKIAARKAIEYKRLESLVELLKPAGEAMREETDSMIQQMVVVKAEETEALRLAEIQKSETQIEQPQ